MLPSLSKIQTIKFIIEGLTKPAVRRSKRKPYSSLLAIYQNLGVNVMALVNRF